MDKDKLHQEFESHHFACCRDARYWAHREVFWRFIDHVCKLFIFLAASGAVCIKAFGGDASSLKWCAAAALATFALESFAVQEKITFAMKHSQRYTALLMIFPINDGEESEALLKRIRNERLRIEVEETILLDCLSVICHNEQCEAEGLSAYKVKIGWFRRTVGRYFPIGFEMPMPNAA